MRQVEVRIGESVLRDEVFDVVIERVPSKHTLETSAKIVLELGRIDLCILNFHWQVVVDSLEGARKRLFAGVVVETFCINHDKLVLICEGSERYAKEYRATYGFHDFLIQEMFFYMARKVPEIQVQEKNIQGLSIKKESRSFKVIMPILNLDVTEKTSVLGVQIRRKDPGSEDEKIITEFCAEGKEIVSDTSDRRTWDQSSTRAEVTIEAAYFDDAALQARERIISVLDWISYVLRLSVLGIRTDRGPILAPWVRDRSFAVISVGEEAYVRDMSEPSPKAYLHDFGPLRGHPSVTLSSGDLKAYSPLKELFESIHIRANDASRRFWLAVHWHRRARESTDQRDRLLGLWVALEFMVADVDVPEVCSSFQVTSLCEDLRRKSIELGVTDPGLAIRRFRETINQPSLRDKFDVFVRRHSIPIEERERTIVWGRLRDARNDLEHGRTQFAISPDDLNAMDQMLSKMILVTGNEISMVSAQ